MSPTRLPLKPKTRSSLVPPLATDAALPTRQPKVGEQFDKYRLLARLATGGMAELFVARLIGAAGFQKNVVIKRILPHVAHDENFTRMFLDEAITCAQISHPNVCQVFELCKDEDSHFLVLEHLEGATVGDLIRMCVAANQQVQMNLAAGIITQACDGLHAAHEQVDANDNNVGLVHRDVSPGNLFVTVDGIVKLLDFGIAKAAWMSRKTRTGTLLGKCEYMSPEQARGVAPIDRRSDVFSLGVIAWEMLCGRRLFRRESEYETLRAVLRAPIESPRSLRPSIPLAFDNAIMRALERDPDDRFHTALEFRQAVAEALRSSGGPTPMCDIAPIIRRSFAEQLRMQRALLKEASRQTHAQGVGPSRVPRGTLPGTQQASAHSGGTNVETAPKITLPSLAPTPSENTASMELTFRLIPETPAAVGRLVPVSGQLASDDTIEVEAAKPRAADAVPQIEPIVIDVTPAEALGDRRRALAARSKLVTKPQRATLPNPAEAKASGEAESPEQAAVQLPVASPFPPRRSAQTSAPPEGDTAARKEETRQTLQPAERKASATSQVLVLLLIGLLGAVLAIALATLYYARGDAQSTPKTESPTRTAPTPVSAPATLPGSAEAKTIASADENEKAQARAMAANSQGHKAIVTSLHAPSEVGHISIRSSKPAKIYLYPTKKLIGTTPLIDFELPPGTHKLKAQIGDGNGRKKYFHVKIEAGSHLSRSFDHW